MKKRPLGVIIFGILLIVSAWERLPWLNFHFYIWYFQPLPEKIILARYIISVLMGIVELASGIGILFLKNIFRRCALFLAFFSILTIYWKHPHFVFQKIVKEIIDASYTKTPLNESVISSIAWTAVKIASVVTFVFSICLIYYFTRPKIKELFN